MMRPALNLGRRRTELMNQPSPIKIKMVPTLSVMIASLSPAFPIVINYPVLPPLGAMVFLGWRLLQRHIWFPWSGVVLGFFNDLANGTPGTATLTWPMMQLIMDLVDQRLPWRDYHTDWRLGSMLITLYLLLALTIANYTGGRTTVIFIMPQIIISILLFPLCIRVCGALDQWRLR
ncbi:MAG: rod shape-determining protein MreD [Alphaproteobacteria bacterium]|nr:rod shape-determining protein MreD [Alphaproteobacteria bacterium]MDE2341748.1 rod shape-determining protein MreD [Alphaproteobacteria bacterium]